MATNYNKYSNSQLEKMKAANSSDWHTAGTAQEKAALHAANVAINKVLDSRKGTTSTFDSSTGKWSETKTGSSGSGSSSSGARKSSSSSGKSSSSGSSGSSGSWLKGLTTVAPINSTGTSLGSGMSSDEILALGKGPLSSQGVSQVLQGNKYPYYIGTGSSGGSYGSSSSGSTGGYAKDAYGQMDYSVMLQDAMKAGAGWEDVQKLLDARTSKAMSDDKLWQYAYDDVYSQAAQYIMGQKRSESQQALADYQTQQADWKQYMQDILNEINLSYQEPGYRPSEWEQTADTLAKAALAMSYDDWAKSDQYAALADRYSHQGQLSMQDVLGQINSRTGGLASSYATTAAQQQSNQYMSQLEQAARAMYDEEYRTALQNAQLAYQFSDRDYQRYLDQLAQYNADRSYGFNVLSAALGQSRYDQEWQNTLQQQQRAWAQQQQAQEYEKDLARAGVLADLGDYSGYGDIYGLTAEQTGALADRYAPQDAAGQMAETAGVERPLLTAAQVNAAIKSGVLTPNVLSAYEYYYGAPYAAGRSVSSASGGNGSGYNNGNRTTQEIKMMQQMLGVEADGFWGPATQSAAGGRTADEVWESMNGGQETASAQNMAAYKQEVARKMQQGLSGEEINDWLMEQPMTEEQREELRKLAVDQLHR